MTSIRKCCRANSFAPSVAARKRASRSSHILRPHSAAHDCFVFLRASVARAALTRDMATLSQPQCSICARCEAATLVPPMVVLTEIDVLQNYSTALQMLALRLTD